MIQNPPLSQPLQVVRVIDGDTIDGMIGTRRTRIRLCGIDAPEQKQTLGPEAAGVLSALLSTGKMSVVLTGKDLYDREIGSVYSGSIPINPEMVRLGFAYHYSLYSKKCPDLAAVIAAENKARAVKAGVWGMPNSIAPWDYRRKSKNKVEEVGGFCPPVVR